MLWVAIAIVVLVCAIMFIAPIYSHRGQKPEQASQDFDPGESEGSEGSGDE